MLARQRSALIALTMFTGLAASCGSTTSSTAPSPTGQVSTTSEETDVVATTDTPTTEPAATEPAATEPAATEPAETDAPAEPATPLPQQKPLHSGTLYKAGKNVIGRGLQFTASVDGSLGFSALGYFGVTLDRLGTELLVGVTDLQQARVFLDPASDLGALDGTAALDDATAPAPDDFLAYFASLPGVVATPVVDDEIAGLPARSLTYTVGQVEGSEPCFGVDRGGCLLATYLPIGVVTTYWEGDSGTMYVVALDDRSIAVDVSDRDGASELAASLRIID